MLSPPQCHPRVSRGAPQWVCTMGWILGWGSPSIWDAGAAPGAGLERCRAVGSPGKPPSPLRTKHAWVCKAQRSVRMDTAPGIQPRGIHTQPRTPRTRSRPPHASPGTVTPARGHAPHLHVPTPNPGTGLYRAVPSHTVPYRAVRSLTGPYRAARVRCGARARARSFIHPPAPWERAARASGGKRSPALAPPLPARMNERAPPSSM